jgi:hypothetical protein
MDQAQLIDDRQPARGVSGLRPAGVVVINSTSSVGVTSSHAGVCERPALSVNEPDAQVVQPGGHLVGRALEDAG